jgi:hypothetical protein
MLPESQCHGVIITDITTATSDKTRQSANRFFSPSRATGFWSGHKKVILSAIQVPDLQEQETACYKCTKHRMCSTAISYM